MDFKGDFEGDFEGDLERDSKGDFRKDFKQDLDKLVVVDKLRSGMVQVRSGSGLVWSSPGLVQFTAQI